ncbi:MAG: BatA domain-containing protein [Bacteroidota bacterium]
MNIGFVEPAFLTALALIAVPIIVHLFNFRKFKVVYFTNVSFLKELKEETNSRSKLKHLLVLASRILAIVFLVFAFAQPFIPRAQGTKSFPGNVVSIYVDNSFSMEALGTKGTRTEEATNIARDIAKSYKPSDRFQLLTNDFDPAHQRLISREEFLSALDQIELSPATRSVSEVLSRQTDLLNTGGSSNKLAIQISDFQKSTTNLAGIKPDSTISVLLVPIGSADADNISVDSCWLASPVVQPGQITEVNVRVRNYGTSDITSVPLKFIVNGSPKSAASVDVVAGSFKDLTLTFTPNDTGWYNCEVSLEDNAVLFDDKYYFSMHVEPSVSMVCINGQSAGSYFRSLFPQEGYFKLQDFTEKQVNYGSLSQARVVILNEVRQPSSGMVAEIDKFVKGGGVAIIIPDSMASTETYSGLSNTLGVANIGPQRIAPDKVDRLQTDDPVFAGVFTGRNGVGASTDLPVVNRSFQLNGGVPEILLKLRSGEPYLNRYRVGAGSVYMLGSSLSGEMSGLSKHAIFVPIFYRMALLATNPQALAVSIGSDASLDITAGGFSGDRIFKIKGGVNGAEFIPTHRVLGSMVKINFGNTIRDAGAYQLSLDGELVSNPSFNYNRAESVMSFNDVDMLSEQIGEARLANFKVDATSGAKALAGTLDSTGVPLWKYCIILALLFLTIEILLLKFWKT